MEEKEIKEMEEEEDQATTAAGTNQATMEVEVAAVEERVASATFLEVENQAVVEEVV